MTKTNKTPDEEPEETIEEVTPSEGATPTEEAAPSKRTYFLPFEGRIIEAEDLADVET